VQEKLAGDAGKDKVAAKPSDSERLKTAIASFMNRETGLDLLDHSAVWNAQQVANDLPSAGDGSSAYRTSMPTPESSPPGLEPGSSTAPQGMPLSSIDAWTRLTCPMHATSRSSRHRSISKDLHALLPSPKLRSILAYESAGARLVLSCYHTQADILAGRMEPVSALANPVFPTPDSHPAVVAKRLMQYAICVQNLAPNFDAKRLDLETTLPCETVAAWTGAVSSLVACDDDLVGCHEGLECLALLNMFQGEAGHLRKAWMTGRRALNLGQVMGIDRPRPPPIRSVAGRDAGQRSSLAVLWYRINCADRYHSLILGLPVGSHSTAFADRVLNNPVDMLGLDALSKMYAVTACRIANRNDLLMNSSSTSSSAATTDEAYALTQSIDLDIEHAVESMPEDWWRIPDLRLNLRPGRHDEFLEDSTAIRLHVRYYSLVIFLHLPYLLHARNAATASARSRYEYSRTACMRASRSVLDNFLAFRNVNIAYIAGRHVDYAALVAVMTLVLGHVGHVSMRDDDDQRERDLVLVLKAKDAFGRLASIKGDRLSIESIETIEAMLPIIEANRGRGDKPVQLSVPFLGTININPRPCPNTHSEQSLEEANVSIFYGPDAVPLATDPPPPPPTDDWFDANMPPSQAVTFTSNQGGDFDASMYGGPEWLGFSADLEDWTFQGVDTTYWSILNQTMP
jgi:hypothetical protein